MSIEVVITLQGKGGDRQRETGERVISGRGLT